MTANKLLNLPLTFIPVWEVVGKKIGGQDLGQVQPFAQEILDRLSKLGVKVVKGMQISPAYDGQCLTLVNGAFHEEGAYS